MIVYFATVFLVVFFAALAQNYDRPRLSNNGLRFQHSQAAGFFFFFVIAVLVFVSGFRYYVGTDYGAYYRGYRWYSNSLRSAILTLKEPGYPLICRVAVLLHGDGATAIFLSSLLMIWPALRMIYRHTDKLLPAALLYIFLGCWSGGFNGVRQYLAATMLFCGYESLEAKDTKRYIFFVLLAFLFHRSSVVMLALIFAVHRKINVRNLAVVVLGGIVLFFFYERVLSFAGWITEHSYSLKDEYVLHTVNILRVLTACAPAIFFLSVLWRCPKDAQTTFYLNLLTIHAAISVATMNSALLYRIGIYSALFQVVAIPELLKRLRPKTAGVASPVITILYAVVWLYEIAGSSSLRSFHWIWQR